MYKIVIKRSADKQLDKISKGDLRAALKIRTFLKELEKVENPFATNNAERCKAMRSLALESWHTLPHNRA